MEFTSETIDYNVAEFYDKFAKDLPKIVLVNQGFYGEISADTFDRGQVIRLHTISQQSRIIAKSVHHNQTKLFSIPLSYEHNFCVVKHHGKGSVGKEMPLAQIIRQYTLPQHVHFPKDKSINVGSHTINTNHLPTMELTQAFNEIYILGNFIIDGVLAHEIVHVPLYLSQLRFSLITGIVGQDRSKWKSYQEELKRATMILEFDKEFGNPEIAEYNHGHIEKVAVDADLEYAKIEPSIYTNFHTIFRAGMEVRDQWPTTEPQDNVYETISNTDDSQVQMTSFKTKLSSAISAPRRPPPTAPKPSTQLKSEDHMEKSTPPTIPQRDMRNSPSLHKKVERPKEQNIYVNNVSHVSPVVKQNNENSSTVASPPVQFDRELPATPPQKVVLQTQETSQAPSKAAAAIEVDALSIEEVGRYMKALRLEKYTEAFKENLMDGKLLKELDKTVMKEEFKMNALEAIRLMAFIEQGHVPS